MLIYARSSGRVALTTRHVVDADVGVDFMIDKRRYRRSFT